MLTCPLCHVVPYNSPVPAKRVRHYMYEHFVSHYRTELGAYVIDNNICRLCGKEQQPPNLLRHVADVHGVLDQLLPKEVSRMYAKKKREKGAARQLGQILGSLDEEESVDDVSSIATEKEEKEMKVDVKSHFQVD
jgi:hypothetical protein